MEFCPSFFPPIGHQTSITDAVSQSQSYGVSEQHQLPFHSMKPYVFLIWKWLADWGH